MSFPIKEVLNIRIEILKRLHKKLNNKCSGSPTTCPRYILFKINFFGRCRDLYWDCRHCRNLFGFLNPHKDFHRCPCAYGISSEIVILRLEEVIEEMQQELSTLGESDEN